MAFQIWASLAKPYAFGVSIAVIAMLLLVPPSLANAQVNMAEELGGAKETFSVKYEIDSDRGAFQVIQYGNGELILLDDSGSLVTDPEILKEIYGLVAYNEAFGSYGIELFAHSAIMVFVVLSYSLWGRLGSILVDIGNTGGSVPFLSDLALQVKTEGEEMLRAEKAVVSNLDWARMWDAASVGSLTNTNAQRMIESQNSRLDARTNEFQAELKTVDDYRLEMRAYLAGIAAQDADVSVANAVLGNSIVKVESAKTHASNYKFRSAVSSLKEAVLQVTRAGEIGQVSLAIHQAELKVNQAEKVMLGNWVATDAISKLESAKTALKSAKAALSTEPKLARQHAEQSSLAASAYMNVMNAPPPPPSEAPTPSAPPPAPSISTRGEGSIPIPILVGAVAAAGAGAWAIYANKSRRSVQKAITAPVHVEKDAEKWILNIKFCINCGKKILQEARHCGSCGALQD